MASCNMGNDTECYTAVVDGNNLNLTPLGKMIMPPPMFEKQATFECHPVCVCMYGSLITVSDTLNNIYVFNATNL